MTKFLRPNFWEFSFRRKYRDNRIVRDVFADFRQCWLVEVQVHYVALHKLMDWLEKNGWADKACCELLWDNKALAWDSALFNKHGLRGARKVYSALLMFLTYALITSPEAKQSDYDEFYSSFASHGQTPLPPSA